MGIEPGTSVTPLFGQPLDDFQSQIPQISPASLADLLNQIAQI
jgi:hypothetical protein